MDYFTLLHLQKEPFSNSPDPEMFFQSTQHQGCLQKLELAVRLRRGLSVVIGDIGTGKSTLCRQLIQRLSKDNIQISPHLILDPEFTTPLEFLTTIAKTFGLDCPPEERSEWQLKDTIKNYLFEQTIQRQKIPVLILDEGQKLPGFGVEILRELLNFETNQYKLLQIVIFAQKEFRAILKQKANFTDRITTYLYLRPLGFRDTRAMIDFRLSKSHTEAGPLPDLFSRTAILAIYCLTRGYPRRIVMLCSKVVISLLINQKKRAGFFEVFRAARETVRSRPVALAWILLPAAGLLILATSLIPRHTDQHRRPFVSKPSPHVDAALVPSTPARIEPPVLISPLSKELTPTVELTSTAPPPTPLPTTDPAASTIPPPAVSPPQTLGTVAVEKGVILSKMVARVYGRYSPPKLAMVLAANPQITTPDAIEVQTNITFPILPHTDLSVPAGQVWVELTEARTLTEAYDVVKEYPETTAPPLLIKPSLTNENTLLFHVILEETFTDEESARQRVNDLPSEWQDQVTVKIL